MDAFAHSFEYALIVLIFQKGLKYVVAGQNDACGVNAEAASNDLERTLRCWIGWALYHGNRGALDRIGNVSLGHDLVRHALGP